MSEQAVRDTQARVYRASEAQTVGLIDIVAAPSKALTAFQEAIMNADDEDADPNGSGSNDDDDDQSGQENAMDPKDNAAQAAAPAATAAAQAVAPAAAAAPAASAAPVDEQAVRTAERERMSAIMNSEEAQGRSALANHLALNTNMSAADAKAMLAVAGKEGAAAVEPTSKEGASAFSAAMDAGKHPNVGAGEGASGAASAEMSAAQRILASQAKATGKKIEVKA
jgi:hypothetical protein